VTINNLPFRDNSSRAQYDFQAQSADNTGLKSIEVQKKVEVKPDNLSEIKSGQDLHPAVPVTGGVALLTAGLAAYLKVRNKISEASSTGSKINENCNHGNSNIKSATAAVETGNTNIPCRDLNQRLLNIQTQADLKLALDVIKETTPFAKKIVNLVEAEQVPMSIKNVDYSHASRSLYQGINYDTTYASEITFRKGTNISEVLHELVHAIPHKDMPAELGEFEIIKLNQKMSDQDIKAKICQISYQEEALAFSAEVLLLDSLKDSFYQGKKINVDSLNTVSNQISSMVKDNLTVPKIAEQIPIKIPIYKELMEQQSESLLAGFRSPTGKLDAIPWGASIEELGAQVDIKNGQAAIKLKPNEFSSKVKVKAAELRRTYAKPDKLAEVMAEINDLIEHRDKVNQQFIAANYDSLELAKDLANINFSSKSNSSKLSNNENLADMQTILESFGASLEFMEKSLGKDSIDTMLADYDIFNHALKFAEHLDEEQAVEILENLLTYTKTNYTENPEHLKELAVASIYRDDTNQAEKLLSSYDKAIEGTLVLYKSTNGLVKEHKIDEEINFNIEHKRIDQVNHLIDVSYNILAQLNNTYKTSLSQYYHHGGMKSSLSKKGEQQISQYLKSHEYIDSRDFFKLIKKLEKSKDYKFPVLYDKDNPNTSREDEYLKSLIKLTDFSSNLTKSKAKLTEEDSAINDRLSKLIKHINQLVNWSTGKIIENKIVDLEQDYNLKNNGDFLALAKEVNNSKASEYIVNLDRFINNEAKIEESTKNLFKSADIITLNQGLDYLKSLPESVTKLKAFEIASKLIKQSTDREFILDFKNSWQNTIETVVPKQEELFYPDLYVYDNFGANMPTKFNDNVHSFIKRENGLKDLPKPDCSYDQSVIYQKSQVQLASFLGKFDSQELKKLSKDILDNLNTSNKNIIGLNKIMMTPRSSLESLKHGAINSRENQSGYVELNTKFDSQTFKLQKLVEAAYLDQDNKGCYIKSALGLTKKINYDVQDFPHLFNSLNATLDLRELLVLDHQFDKAQEINNFIKPIVDQASQHWKQAKSSDVQKNQQAVELLDVYLFNEIENFTKDDLYIREFYKAQNTNEASSLLNNKISDYQDDINHFKDRFSIADIAKTAKTLDEIEGLMQEKVKIYELAIEKATQKKGDYSLYGSDKLIKDIKASKLADNDKDDLLSKAVQNLLPLENFSTDKSYMIPDKFFELAEETLTSESYPKLSSAFIERLNILAQNSKYQDIDAYSTDNSSGFRMQAKIFQVLAKAKPALIAHKNFSELNGIADNDLQRKGVNLLNKRAYHEHLSQNSELLPSLSSIKDYSNESLSEARAKLQDNLISSMNDADKSKFDLSLKNLLEFIVHEAEDLNKADSRIKSAKNFVIDQYQNSETFKFFEGLFQQYSKNDNKDYFRDEICMKLIKSDSAKLNKYLNHFKKQVLLNDEVNFKYKLEALVALESDDKVPGYLSKFFKKNLVDETDTNQLNSFFRLANKISSEFGNKVSDFTCHYALNKLNHESEQAATEFLDKFKSLQEEYNKESNFDLRMEISSMNPNSNKDFKSKRANKLKNTDYPSYDFKDKDFLATSLDFTYETVLFKDLDYEKNFDNWYENIRDWLVYESFDFSKRGPNESKDQITTKAWLDKVGRSVANFNVPEEKLVGFESYLVTNNFNRSPQALKQYLEDSHNIKIEFLDSEIQAIRNLESFNSITSKNIPYYFGLPECNIEEKELIKSHLDEIVQLHSEMKAIKKPVIKLPESFSKLTPTVKNLLISYIGNLNEGKQIAIKDSFDASGLTQEKAFKKFFEITGNEKLGQFLSFRKDLVPESYALEFSEFQENVEPSSYSEVKDTIQRKLDSNIFKQIKDINKTPLKVGTIGEVYELTLNNEEKAVIKVITPSKKRALMKNLQALENTAMEASKLNQDTDINILSTFKEFRRSILKQLNLKNEYNNALEFKQKNTGFNIPDYKEEFLTDSTLVMSYIEGENPLEVDSLQQRKLISQELASLVLDALTNTSNEDTLIHEDLHPGNIRANLQGATGLLDFGDLIILSGEDRKNLQNFMLEFSQYKPQKIKPALTALEKLGFKSTLYNSNKLSEDLISLLDNKEIPLVNKINKIINAARSNGLYINNNYIKLTKALATWEGTVHSLDPSFDLKQAYTQKYTNNVNKFELLAKIVTNKLQN
jgi:predicted unusual protein kinase regulating ubiquinone biosynthesis (AarF/ABC1/UbiB family)